MFHYFTRRMEVSSVADAVLKDEETSEIDPAERMVVENRLYQHMTGKRPIRGDEWLNEELKREKKRKKSSQW